ncbi:MAG: chromate efflux transporter [Bdellovibrionota bacterium]
MRHKTVETACIFFRLGMLGFGGPIATMAMIEEEICRRRRWFSSEHFAEMYAVLKLLPGPISTQMAIYAGRFRGGLVGGVVAGCAFVMPAFLLVILLAHLYLRLGSVASFSSLLLGFQAGAFALIVLSIWQLAKPHVARREAWVIAAVSCAVVFAFPRWEPLVILLFGLCGVFFSKDVKLSAKPAPLDADRSKKLYTAGFLSGVGFTVFRDSVLTKLFWVCFKAGAFVVGTGLAIVPLLEADVVQHHKWLNHSEFMDAIAIGQVTPGPVVITATFIGYKVAGIAGAVCATVGIFLPAFVNILFIVPRAWRYLSGTRGARGFASWAIPSVIGAIAGATMKLALLTMNSWIAVLVALVSLFCVVKFRSPPWLLVPLSGAAAWALIELSAIF